jgi:hypothetical protein
MEVEAEEKPATDAGRALRSWAAGDRTSTDQEVAIALVFTARCQFMFARRDSKTRRGSGFEDRTVGGSVPTQSASRCSMI